MKTKYLIVLISIVFISYSSTIQAQFMRISAFGQEGIVLGEITKKDMASNTAGYVDFSSSGGLEFNYFLKNNLGFGIRVSGNSYLIDTETYKEDLIKMLNITNNQYDITQTYAYWSMGSDIGISYLGNISKKWQIEPYFYFGFNFLTSPATVVVYSNNNTTYQYKEKVHLFAGVNYTPGVKVHWNALKHVGFYLSVEFDGNSYLKDEVRILNYSYNTFDIKGVDRKYNFNSINIGLGLAFRFGKGIDK